MNGSKQLQKLVLAASLAAVSVVIDVFFKYALNIQNFGLPFYAIPIILGSIILGPFYGIGMAVVGDAIGVVISGQIYLPLFVLAPIMWGLIPGLLLHKRYTPFKLSYVVPLSYLFASLSNTLALYIYFGNHAAFALLIPRLALIPFNSVIIFILVRDANQKLLPFSERFNLQIQKT